MKKVVTYQSPGTQEKIDVCPKCEIKLKGGWPKDNTGEEYCTIERTPSINSKTIDLINLKEKKMKSPPPKATGLGINVNLNGKLFAWDLKTKQPHLINIEGSNEHYWPIFDDPNKLNAFMNNLFKDYSIKQIDDQCEFITLTESTGGGYNDIILIYNPHVNEKSKLRWFQLGTMQQLKDEVN